MACLFEGWLGVVRRGEVRVVVGVVFVFAVNCRGGFLVRAVDTSMVYEKYL